MYWLVCVFLFLITLFQLPSNELKVGDKIPDFKITINQGDTLFSDSLKGRTMVIDFWASWCQPARRNNVESIRIYDKFRHLNSKKKNHIIFISISLDTQRELWLVAKAKDNLHWPYNVNDPTGWESLLAKQFLLRKIPSNFVVDTSGTIVAKDVWGGALDSTLRIWNK